MMSNQFKISWPRIIAEGSAIVVSILLAFWIQAWWESRQAHSAEQIILAALSVELRSLAEEYDARRQYINALRESGRTMIIASGNPNNRLSDEEMDSLLGDLTWYTYPNPFQTPELDSLISSGDISLISNFSLRRRLAVLPASLDELRHAFEKSYNFFNNEFMPYLARAASLPQIYDVSIYQPGNQSIQYPKTSVYERNVKRSHQSLLENVEFQNMLTIRLGNFDEILEYYSRTTKESIDESLKLIDSELAGKHGETD